MRDYSTRDSERPGRRNDDDDRSRRGRDDEPRSRRRDSDDEPRSRRRDPDDEPPRRGRGDDDDRGARRSGRSGFVYRERDADDVKKRAQGQSDFDSYLSRDVKMYKPENGDREIRILPPTWEGAKHYGLDIWVHYGVGPDRQTYLCLHKMKGEPCPICEERQRAQRSGDDDYAKELEPKRRVLTYVIDRDAEKEGVQAWPMPQGTDQDIVQQSVDKRSGAILPVDNPDDGFDIAFEKTGTGIKTRYEGVQVARRSSPLGDDRWLDYAIDHPLPEALVYYDYDHIAKEFGGGAPREDSDRRPASRSRDRDDDRDDGRGRGRDRNEETRRSSREEAPSRARREEPAYTWEQVHKMAGRELDALIEEERLKLDPDAFPDDEALADAICEEMGVRQAPARQRVVDRDDDDVGERFRRMRGD